MLPSIPLSLPVPEAVHDPFLQAHEIQLDVLRLDQIHPLINGNKWFKLKHNLRAAGETGHSTLLSFGGAYSNHIRALAAAARLGKFNSIGIIRGELAEPLNPVLAFAREQGMALHPVSRADYRRKHEAEFMESLRDRFGAFFLIPEGGNNAQGVRGCEEIMDILLPHLEDADDRPVTVACACGTGATLAGLARGARRLGLKVNLLGIAVLRGAGYLAREVQAWLPKGDNVDMPRWHVSEDYHWGGYGKSSAELEAFITAFQLQSGVPLEPVYTGKLVYALYDLIRLGEYAPGSRIVCLHTGGIYY